MSLGSYHRDSNFRHAQTPMPRMPNATPNPHTHIPSTTPRTRCPFHGKDLGTTNPPQKTEQQANERGTTERQREKRGADDDALIMIEQSPIPTHLQHYPLLPPLTLSRLSPSRMSYIYIRYLLYSLSNRFATQQRHGIPYPAVRTYVRANKARKSKYGIRKDQKRG